MARRARRVSIVAIAPTAASPLAPRTWRKNPSQISSSPMLTSMLQPSPLMYPQRGLEKSAPGITSWIFAIISDLGPMGAGLKCFGSSSTRFTSDGRSATKISQDMKNSSGACGGYEREYSVTQLSQSLKTDPPRRGGFFAPRSPQPFGPPGPAHHDEHTGRAAAPTKSP